jgi:hypothetical protein
MPYLEDITYSEEACISVIQDYCHFLAKLYLDESKVVEPPEGGWPSITPEAFAPLNKSDTVVSLLRHLPYIQQPNPGGDLITVGAPLCWFADWAQICAPGWLDTPQDVEDVQVMSQNLNILVIDPEEQPKLIPPHVIGLTFGARNNSTILLDTELAVIYWVDCPGRIERGEDHPAWHHETRVHDDVFEYAPEEEVEWRSCPAWPVAGFFAMLKQEFIELRFIPTSSTEVVDVVRLSPACHGVLQDIYHQHGWPDLDRYRKSDCLRAVERALQERDHGARESWPSRC